MASIISGYNYDIFISYRQKDNKGDRWVSEFVDALKDELESTFKEEISVYFDINPHDGLLETYDVDESLKEKLKCLIFIPIISRTYCDPKSFAWEHEFKTFVNKASNDQFGLKIKLPNGNVASRVLPVQIYNLDNEDIKLCESVLGGVLRGVEFIYKESGVNRPLLSNEDRPQDNLNNTFYRNQINKVANAIKEIIGAIMKYNSNNEEITEELSKTKSQSKINLKMKFFVGFLMLLVLTMAGYFFIPKLSQSSELIDKSIAVLPFDNLSNDPEQDYFSDGIVEAILDRLFKVGDLEVISSTSTKRYKNTNLSIKEIAKELDVSSILEGSVQKIGDNVRIIVQLINAKSDAHLWSETYDRNLSDVFSIQSEVAQNIAKELHAVITPEVKRSIEKAPTIDMEAYDAYLKGHYYYELNIGSATKEAISWFNESIRLDSAFSLPWTYLSMCYWRLSINAGTPEFQEAKRMAESAIELDPASGVAIVNMAEILDNEYDFEGAEEKIKLALNVDPDNPYVLRNAGRFYTKFGKREESITYCIQALQYDPINPTALGYLTEAYFYAGLHKEAWSTFTKYRDLKYTGLTYLFYQLLLEEGNFERVVREGRLRKDDNPSIVALTAAYFKMGYINEAEKLCDQLLKKNIYGCAYWIAFAHAYGEDPEKVYSWLEKSFATKEEQFTYSGVEPAFKNFRNEPRIKKLLQQMKFPI